MQEYIKLQAVSVAYGSKKVLQEINFTLHKGECVALLGPSGSGKSTILRLIIGLQEQTSGEVFLKNKAVQQYSKSELEQLFRNYGIKVDNCVGYDVMYVYHMAKSDFFESSIISEQYLLQFVKDYLDDIDGYDGKALTRFYADCIGSGTPIM